MKMSSQETMKFGYVTYEEVVPIASEFAKYLEEGKIMGNRCKKCDTKFLPPRSGCNKCFSTDMEYFEVKPEATLRGFTVIHFAPESFSDKAPYIVAVGELENGLSVLAHLVGVTSMPDVGMKMKLVPQKISKDRIVYKFTKA